MEEASSAGSTKEIANGAFDVLLREVLNYLPVRDLLSCSLVNKYWNYEARCILRDKRTCIASVRSDHACASLLDLNNLLARMCVIPFNGLRMRMKLYPRGTEMSKECCEGQQHLVSQFAFILNEWPLKYLEIISFSNYIKDCLMDEIMGRLVIGKGGTLEQIFIDLVPRSLRKYIQVKTELWLPKLKVIHVNPSIIDDHNLFTITPLHAPNLEVILGGVVIDDLGALHPSKYMLVKELHLYFLDENYSKIDASAIGRMSLWTLNVSIYVSRHPPQCWEIVSTILENSKKSLKRLRIAACPLLSLVRTGKMIVMENVETLTLGILPYYYEKETLSQLQILTKVLRLSTLFPNLKSVKLVNDFNGDRNLHHLCYCRMNQDQATQGSSASSAVSLNCPTYNFVSSQHYLYISKMFPKIQEFVFNEFDSNETTIRNYMNVWSFWPDLKMVALTFHCDWEQNYDWLFCGISEEEARFLQKSSSEFLSRVVIVPTKPPIHYFHNLKQLSLQIFLYDIGSREFSDLFFLSKVSGYLAFRRMSVDINVKPSSTKLSLEHDLALMIQRNLVPFVSVKCERLYI